MLVSDIIQRVYVVLQNADKHLGSWSTWYSLPSSGPLWRAMVSVCPPVASKRALFQPLTPECRESGNTRTLSEEDYVTSLIHVISAFPTEKVWCLPDECTRVHVGIS